MVLEWPERFVFGITDSGVFVFPVNNFVPCGCFGVLFINCIFSPKSTSITTIVCSYYFTFYDL